MSKRTRTSSDDSGLNEDEQRLLRGYIHCGGVTAKAVFSKMHQTLANRIGKDVSVVKAFLKKHQNETADDDEWGGWHPVHELPGPSTQAALAVPNLSNGGPTPSLPQMSADLLRGVIQNLRNSIAQQQQQVDFLETSAGLSLPPVPVIPPPAPSVSFGEARNDTSRVIAAPKKLRVAPTVRAYDLYLAWAGKEIQKINREGLENNPEYKVINKLQWDAKHKAQNNNRILWDVIKEKGTEEHAALMSQWEREAEDLKRSGPRYQEIPAQIYAQEKGQIIERVLVDLKTLAASYNVQAQGYVYDAETGASKNLCTGNLGRKVSQQLSKRPMTNPPSMFFAEHYKLSKKGSTLVPSLSLDTTNDMSGDALRLKVRSALLDRINQERAKLKLEATNTVQISKLLSLNGFQGVKLVGFPLTAKQYKGLQIRQCKTILNELKVLGKIRLELVNDAGDEDSREPVGPSGMGPGEMVGPSAMGNEEDLGDSDNDDMFRENTPGQADADGRSNDCDENDSI